MATISKYYTSPGSLAATYYWVAPSDVTAVKVEIRAPGGGSGGLTTNAFAIGGAAGGQYVVKNAFTVTPGNSYLVTLGASGAAGSGTGPTAGTAGGDTWFSSNDASGVVGKGGLPSLGNSRTGGVGSTTGGVGDTVYAGGSGATSTTTNGGGGGEGGRSGAAGANGAVTAGGSGGDGGDGGNGATNGTGGSPAAFGGGGGGSASTGTNDRSGRGGAPGSIVLTYTTSVVGTTFLEPGGDADFLFASTNGFWKGAAVGAVIATDFVHGGHIKSIDHGPGVSSFVTTMISVLSDTGSRISLYLYLVALPSSVCSIIRGNSGQLGPSFNVRLTSTGVVQLWDTETAQIGTDGPTLATGQWYRISLAYTVTSTTVNRFELFVDGVVGISVTDATLTTIKADQLLVGNRGSGGTPDAALDMRMSDHYVDDSPALTDPGNIWVTAKRPNANGTTNGFTTQIGVGGSGYGTGHSPQVNERALSVTNGWSMIGAGAAVIEEYNIEGAATGDIDISTATIVDWLGWVSTSSLVAETVNVIIDGVSVPQTITSTATLYTKINGSSTYPSGTGDDIGIQTDTSLTTVSLYECGVLVAYIPAAVGNSRCGNLMMMGVGS